MLQRTNYWEKESVHEELFFVEKNGGHRREISVVDTAFLFFNRIFVSTTGLEIGDLKITSTSTERQKRSQNLAPVLVIILGPDVVQSGFGVNFLFWSGEF